jgi:membrane protein implicated in regulation of membrane protease activity
VRGWLVVISALALLFLLALSVFVGLSWFVDAAWPWSGVILAGAFSAGVAWAIRTWLRVRGQHRTFEGELRRIGVDGLVEVVVLGDGVVSISDRSESTSCRWMGTAADARRRIAGLPDGSGWNTFWDLFPDRGTKEDADLDEEHSPQVDVH